MVKTTTPRTPKNQATEHAVIDFDALRNVEHTNDVVEYTIRCLLAVTPRLAKAVEEAAVNATRKQVKGVFGGEKPYVAKTLVEDSSLRNEQIRRLYQSGERVSYLERKFQLSARQIYRIIDDGM